MLMKANQDSIIETLFEIQYLLVKEHNQNVK